MRVLCQVGNSKFGGESPDAGRQQLRPLVLTALTELRESLRGLSTFKLAVRTVAFRPGPLACPEAAVKQVLKALACRWLDLGREIGEFEGALSKVVSAAASALVAYTGSVPKWQPPSWWPLATTASN
jgi:hypothetical protein